MKKLLIIITLLAIQFTFSQENVNHEDAIESTLKRINSRRGQFFMSWGWNRSSYEASDIHFNGNGFDFTLNNVKADDKPKPFGIEFLDPGGLTLPQTNLEIGYFFRDNYNIVLGYDHMKYVLRNGEDVKINGEIAVGDYLFDGTTHNFDGNYNYELINLSRPFISFEHTDGLNYVFVGVNRFDNLNKLFHINTDKFEINIEEGIDVGFVMPKTNSTLLGNERYDEFNVAGFGMSASAGLNLTFFKHFFIKTDFKFGYIDMGDIRITNDPSETASQHFTFAETSYTFGYRFNLFSKKEKPVKKITYMEPEATKNNAELISTKTVATDSIAIKKADTTKTINPVSTTTKKSNVVKTVDSNSTKIIESNTTKIADSTSSITEKSNLDKKVNTVLNTTKTKPTSETIKCPGKKALAYKEKSNDSNFDKSAQKAYSWLALYYTYKCECENGTRRPESLIAIINNVVDSYIENTDGSYEKISKVKKCKTLKE